MRKYLWIIPILFAVIRAPNAHAQTTYTYTGNDFTNFVGLPDLTCPPDCSIDWELYRIFPLGRRYNDDSHTHGLRFLHINGGFTQLDEPERSIRIRLRNHDKLKRCDQYMGYILGFPRRDHVHTRK
jgi:hypothetical protein